MQRCRGAGEVVQRCNRVHGCRGAEEQRSRGAEEQRSGGAEEQRSRGAEEQRSREAEEQRSIDVDVKIWRCYGTDKEEEEWENEPISAQEV